MERSAEDENCDFNIEKTSDLKVLVASVYSRWIFGTLTVRMGPCLTVRGHSGFLIKFFELKYPGEHIDGNALFQDDTVATCPPDADLLCGLFLKLNRTKNLYRYRFMDLNESLMD